MSLSTALSSDCFSVHTGSSIMFMLVLAISNAQISLILPGLELLVGTNVRVSGDSARRALSNGVCNTIYN